MEPPHSMSGMVALRCLELMGFTQHYRAGDNRVLISSNPDERLVFRLQERWDIPREDIEKYLRDNNLSLKAFWNAYESLYS